MAKSHEFFKGKNIFKITGLPSGLKIKNNIFSLSLKDLIGFNSNIHFLEDGRIIYSGPMELPLGIQLKTKNNVLKVRFLWLENFSFSKFLVWKCLEPINIFIPDKCLTFRSSFFGLINARIKLGFYKEKQTTTGLVAFLLNF